MASVVLLYFGILIFLAHGFYVPPTNVRFEGNNAHDVDVTRCLLLTLSGRLSPRLAVLP